VTSYRPLLGPPLHWRLPLAEETTRAPTTCPPLRSSVLRKVASCRSRAAAPGPGAVGQVSGKRIQRGNCATRRAVDPRRLPLLRQSTRRVEHQATPSSVRCSVRRPAESDGLSDWLLPVSFVGWATAATGCCQSLAAQADGCCDSGAPLGWIDKLTLALGGRLPSTFPSAHLPELGRHPQVRRAASEVRSARAHPSAWRGGCRC
jgi:hypothetical protein